MIGTIKHPYIPHTGVNLGEKTVMDIGVRLAPAYTPIIVQMLDFALFFLD